MAAVRLPKPEVVHLGRRLRHFIEIWFGNRFPTPWRGVTNRNSIKYCRKTANINAKKTSVLQQRLWPIVHDTYKKAKINFINSGPVDIIRTVYYIHGPELIKLIFAVLYVS